MMQNVVPKPYLPKLKYYLLLVLGSLSWILTMVKSGWLYSSLGQNGSGLGFWGANGHDGIWHIALAESFSRGSLQMPTFAGSYLKNYHIGFDLLLAILHRVTFIPTVNLYFQIIPILLSVITGYLVYKFVIRWVGSENAAWWATFFVYFGGSFGWILGRGESAFWSQEAISTLINPPLAFSFILLMLGLLLLYKLENRLTLGNFVITILVFGSLIEVKSYAGVLALGALFVSGFYLYIFYKKTFLLKVFAGSLVLSALLYFPLNSTASGLLVFQPFWFLETMMGLVDRLNYQKFYSAMLSYRSGHNYFKAIPAYFISFVIFFIGNMGMRMTTVFEFFKWFKKWNKLGWMEVFSVSIVVGGLVIPLIFLQKGTPWNTIQFFYYSLFISALLAGVAVSKIKSQIILLLIFLFTLPTTLFTLKDVYIPGRPPAMISQAELSALSFLSNQPDGAVLTKPFDEAASKKVENNPPRPLYLYTSTAYVSAFSKHPTFLEDEINLDITDYEWLNRRMETLNWYQSLGLVNNPDFLRNNSIKYIYWIKEGQSPLDLAKLGIRNIYENNLVTIYQVE